ncbi:hypothetical protein FACS1894219_10000 [Clostridia bacterium]|nr:hypothetical protein FACS1894219_10000 [Clostridia bacterium]
MPNIGLKHVVGAVLDETGDSPAYSSGMIIGKAISANISIELAQATLYADDSVAESIKEFKSGKFTLNTAGLSYAVQAMLLGHTVAADTLTANSNDFAPYVGIGFYGSVMRGGVIKYRAVWFGKCMFGEFSDESKTKADSIEFVTPTIEGTVLRLASGVWKIETTVSTEAVALAWIDNKAGIEAE